MVFHVWFLSLGIMFLRFIHVVISIRTSFLFTVKEYSIMWTPTFYLSIS